jgi:hypothetical protein
VSPPARLGDDPSLVEGEEPSLVHDDPSPDDHRLHIRGQCRLDQRRHRAVEGLVVSRLCIRGRTSSFIQTKARSPGRLNGEGGGGVRPRRTLSIGSLDRSKG